MNKFTTITMTLWDLYSQRKNGQILPRIKTGRKNVYNVQKQVLLIDSIINNVPLPTFYFWKNLDGNLEVLDGEQRLNSIYNFIHNNFTYKGKTWYEWENSDRNFLDKFKNIQFSAFICEGDEEYKRMIFQRINTLGISLSKFEMINQLYPNLYIQQLKNFVKTNPKIKLIFETNYKGNIEYFLLSYLTKSSNIDDILDYISNKTNFDNDYKVLMPILDFIVEVFKFPRKFKKEYFNLANKFQDSKEILLENKFIINNSIKDFYQSKTFKIVKNIEKWLEDLILSVIENSQKLDN